MTHPGRKPKSRLFLIACLFLFGFFLIAFIDIRGFIADAGLRYVKDGKEYGVVKGAFRNRWWNYYERGISFADGRFYAEAVEDFKEALDQRNIDQRMARTYGMHFIDYFPNRELGVVHYQRGNLDEAKKLLELSNSQYPSAKARFYLDRVRKEMIQKAGQAVAAPVLALDIQKNEIRTRADPVIISGSAADPNFVSAVAVNDSPVFLDGSQQHIVFEKKLTLGQGRHEITVTAKNLLEKQTDKKIILHVDRNGPFVSLDAITHEAGGGKVGVSGLTQDESGIASLKISGVDIPTRGNAEVAFSQAVTVTNGALELRTEDSLGNVTTAKIAISKKTAGQKQNLLASLDSDLNSFLTASILAQKDKNPPVIKLKDWADTQTVFMEKIYLEGEIADENKIVSITVDRVPVLRREGQLIIFNQLIDLKEGNNVITVEAADEAGNTSAAKIQVVRQTPKALTLAERLSVAVLPFEARGEMSQAFTSFQEKLISSLADRDRFNLVERDRLDAILQEQKLSQTELVDKNTALKVGKLVAAQSIITGSMIETRTGVEIVARMIDTETAEILAAEDVYDEGKDLRTLSSLSAGMAVKFHREFPLVFGMVVQHKGGDIFTDLGQGVVKVPRRLIVYRESPIIHPVSGKVLGSDNLILGRLRVTQVMEDLSKAKLLGGDDAQIKLMDKVVSE